MASKSITLEAVRKKYGDDGWEFKSYYKYSFVYTKGPVRIVVGGNGDDIYRFEAKRTMTLFDLEMSGDVECFVEDSGDAKQP